MTIKGELELENVKTPQKRGRKRSAKLQQEPGDEALQKIERKRSQYPSLSESVSKAIRLRSRTIAEEEESGGRLVVALDKDQLALRRIGLRWAILKCLHRQLTDVRFDIPQHVNKDLGVARSIIETGCSNPDTANGRLSWVEHALMEKAISLSNLGYWEAILRKYHSNRLTKAEIESMPHFQAIVGQYPFIAYCMS